MILEDFFQDFPVPPLVGTGRALSACKVVIYGDRTQSGTGLTQRGQAHKAGLRRFFDFWGTWGT